MYYKIETSGCCEREGNIQVRFDFFLDKGDSRYEERYVDITDFPEKTPSFKTEKDMEDWIKKLPTKKQLNPFHVHFAYFDNDVTDIELETAGENFLQEAYALWSKNKFPEIKNAPFVKKQADCSTKLNHIVRKWQQ